MLLILVLLASQISYAEVYRYVDENGVTVFTDSLPRGLEAEVIKSPTAPRPRPVKTAYDYHTLIMKHAGKYNIDPSLIKAVIKAESNYNASAVSRRGAMGLMQLMPATAQTLGVKDPFDPDENIEGGVRYLKHLLIRFDGDIRLALAAYNAGPEPVEKFGNVPPISETVNYIKKVLTFYKGKRRIPQDSKSATFYRVVLDDGSLLFTNSLPKKKSRL